MRFTRFWLAGLLALMQTAAPAAASTADEVVRTTTDSVIARLSAEKADLEQHPEKIYGLIDELVLPHFDFASMSKWVLGKSWKEASQAQQQSFIDQFRVLLVRTYAKALLEYSNEEIKFYPGETTPDSNLVVVRTEVAQSTGGGAIPIHYRLHVSGGDWKVVDVAVDGVSLVSTYRGSFAPEIQKVGLDGLIAKLAERNEKALPLESEGSSSATRAN
jgi:phospholipid transport system substrate-binding protein